MVAMLQTEGDEPWSYKEALLLLSCILATSASLFMCVEEIIVEEDDSETYAPHHRHHSKKPKKKKKKKRWRFANMSGVVKPKQGQQGTDVAMDESKLPTGAGVPSLMPVEQQPKSTKETKGKSAKASPTDDNYGTLRGIDSNVFGKG